MGDCVIFNDFHALGDLPSTCNVARKLKAHEMARGAKVYPRATGAMNARKLRRKLEAIFLLRLASIER